MFLAFRSSTSTSVTQLPVSTTGWLRLTLKDKCKVASLGDVVVATLSVEMQERTESLCCKWATLNGALLIGSIRSTLRQQQLRLTHPPHKHDQLLFVPQYDRPSFAPTSINRPDYSLSSAEHIRCSSAGLAHLQLHFQIRTDDFHKCAL